MNVTNSKRKGYFKKTITNGDDFLQTTVPPGAHEIEVLIIEIKRIFVGKGHFTKPDFPFKIKPKFSTIIGFVFNDSIRNLLGFHEIMLFKENNLSPNSVDIFLFDNIFLGCAIAKGMNYKQKRSGILHNWTMTVNPV